MKLLQNNKQYYLIGLGLTKQEIYLVSGRRCFEMLLYFYSLF